MIKTPSAIIIFFILINLILPFPGRADNDVFDPNYIISDYDLTNYDSMTLDEIQNFLENFGGILKNYLTEDIDGKEKLASEIIYRASQEYTINPQIIITLVQKEQTLISRPPIKPTQLDWATGFGAYDGRRPVQRFKGFATQIDRAAWRLRYFLEHPWEFRYRPGQTNRISWRKVTPQNAATAAFYNYTPHIKGNELLWKIWQRWFAETIGQFPDGSLLQITGEAGIWLIQNNKRRPFRSKNVFLLSYNFKNVKLVNKPELEQYEIGEAMKFPNYSLVQASLGNIFMLVKNEKRPISEKIFKAIGFHPDEIIKAEDNDLIFYKLGQSIISPYPNGALLQDRVSKGVYYVKEDTKYPIVDIEILNNNFPYNSIIKTDSQELAEFKNGPAIKFRDGILLKTINSPAVYVIGEGKRLPIFSEKTFEALGYKWDNIITISEIILNMHPLNEILKIE
ncbi:hypothetical protein IID20_02495 [Patescibacteria group bacterium]|nr:hypothetical protein [Patescibacteria group bacterium]